MTTKGGQQSRSDSIAQTLEPSPGSFPGANTKRTPAKVGFRFRSIVLAGLAVFLVWEVITRSLVATLAGLNPQAALSLRPTDSTSLLNLAEKKLDPSPPTGLIDTGSLPNQTDASKPNPPGENVRDAGPIDPHDRLPALAPEEFVQIRTWAESALFNDPLNARALRILGQLSLRDSNDERTATLMRAAARRSLLESTAVYWMMRKSYRDQNFGEAIRYADILLRTRPSIPQYGVSLIARLAEGRDSIDSVLDLLSENPPWRPKFFEYVTEYISDPRTPLRILLALKETQAPLGDKDLSTYLKYLIGKGHYDLAYYTWLQLLPPEQLRRAGHLFNGNFNSPPSGLPFDWVFTAGSGATIEIAPQPESNDQALFVQFGPGRVGDFGVAETMMLAPGTYRFTGKFKSDIDGPRGPKWTIKCAIGSKALIGQSPTTNRVGVSWESFAFSFEVPTTDCSEQQAELVLDSRSAADRFVSGSVWYDDLQILHAASMEGPQLSVPNGK